MSACEATSGCYELYSIGSAKFLREIFNSVAMITGSGDFLGACAVAIMLGVILAVIKGIMTGGGKIEVGAIVVSSLVTCIMFVPRATVVVEDVYNGSTYAVDNVPIGVAAPGMFISRVGFTIAELMDQGFSTVDTNFGITNRPFLESTKILSNLRNPQFANSVWDQLGKHTNSDVKRSFYNFFKECTMLKYNFDKTKSVDQDQKMTLENLMDDFQSNVFYTEIYVDGKAVTKTCNDANAILKSKINQLNGDLVNNAMPAPKEYGSNTATEMTDAISMLRLTSADAMEMVKLSIVQPVYDKALAGDFDNSGDVVAALTINNAIQQRNAQWSMEQSLFLNTVRPIITFFEGFVYAVTPFMAILICMGAFGLGIAIKYFQTLIWIQLWMPILAIINLYIYMSAQGAVDSAGIVDKHIDSFYALGTLAQTVETWTSVGGMLAAMTPVIAFFIVAGSAYTFTSIASKLNGADHIDEKAMSPDVLKQAPMFANSKGTYEGTNSGQIATGMQSQEEQINFGKATSETRQSAFERRNQASVSLARNIIKMGQVAESGNQFEAFMKVLNQNGVTVTSEMFNDALNTNKQRNTTSSASNGRNNSEQSQWGYGGSLEARLSKNLTEIANVAGLLNGLGNFAKSLIPDVSLSAKGDLHYTNDSSEQGGSTVQVDTGKGNSQGKSSAITNSDGTLTNHGKGSSGSKGGQHAIQYTTADLGQFTEAANNLDQASKSYNQADKLEKSMSTTHSMTAKEAAYNIGDRGDWEGLRKLIQQSNLGSSVNSKQAYYQDRLGYSPELAHRAALLMTAINEGNTDTSLKALSMIGEATGKHIDHIPDHDKYRDINPLNPTSTGLNPEVVSNRADRVISTAANGATATGQEVANNNNDLEGEVNTAAQNAQAKSDAKNAQQEMLNDPTISRQSNIISKGASYLASLLPGKERNNDIDSYNIIDDPEHIKDYINNSLAKGQISMGSDLKEDLHRLVILGSKSGLDGKRLEDIKKHFGNNQTISQAIETLAQTVPMTTETMSEDNERTRVRMQLFDDICIGVGQMNAYKQKNPKAKQEVKGNGQAASTVTNY